MDLRTIDIESFSELEDRKSRFFGFLVPFSAFDARLAELRKEHRKANHHVTAFRRMMEDGRIEEGAKDDGEPAGTSGMPCLKVLQGAQLVNVGLIVVRYFGGVKLGGGGLARAYSGAAKRAIELATVHPWVETGSRTLEVGFADAADLEQRVAANGLTVTTRDYTENGVKLVISGPVTALKRL